MQQLCSKVKMASVDARYHVNPSAIINFDRETRLRATEQEAKNWREELSKECMCSVLSRGVYVCKVPVLRS